MLSGRAIFNATRVAAPSRAIAPKVLASSQIRSYATPAPAEVKPPIALYGLDGTYATALVRSYLLVILPGWLSRPFLEVVAARTWLTRSKNSTLQP